MIDQNQINQHGARVSIERSKPWLAPLAGYSDLPFRLLCRSFGAYGTVTEMISAKGLVYGSPATSSLLACNETDSPLVVQLFGNDPDNIALAVRMLRKRGFNNFDLNVGCPVRKVFKQHSGASLLDDARLLLNIAKAMLAAVKEEIPEKNLPAGTCSFKLRTGVRPEKAVLPDLACALEDLGADWITVHPRFASQGYSGEADWNILYKTAQRLAIPLVASGDLTSAKKGLECLDQTGAASLMYARGALYNPAIFEDHQHIMNNGQPKSPGFARTSLIIKKHIELAREFGNPKNSFIKMRSLLPRYIRDFAGVQNIRREICQCGNWEELENMIDNLEKRQN